jgi:hypothetical protein
MEHCKFFRPRSIAAITVRASSTESFTTATSLGRE